MERSRWLFAAISIAFAAPVQAQGPITRSDALVQPARFDRAPTIDGRLDDAVWATAARLQGFRQIQPGDNGEPSQSTEVLVGYDRRALYLAFRARESTGRIRATLARRDAIVDDDMVGVYLDTFRDRRRAYYVFFNPYGIQADGIYTEGAATPDLTIDLVIESKGAIDRDGYAVEAAIPFASLRYDNRRTSGWGLHVQRFIRDRDEQISWRPMSRNRSSLLDQAGELGALTDIGEGRPLDIIPTGIATQVSSGPGRPQHDSDPGLTVALGITPTMNAALTLNPDFAQVEADQLVLTVNQRFPLFYDEKRPFFLEGIDVFQTPMPIVHTRTIVAPDQAVKLTGKQGRTSVGLLFANDGAAKTAIRLKRDVGRESTVGLAATAIRDETSYSTLVSADARIRLSAQSVLTAQLAGSVADAAFHDPSDGGTRPRYGSGLAYHAKLERRGRHALFAVTATGSSPDYRADLGFVRRVNTNAVSVQTSYTSEPHTNARLISWSVTNIAHAQWDWQGRANFVYIYPQLHLNFRRQTYVRAYGYRDYERLFEEEFGRRRSAAHAGAFAGDGERSTSWEGYAVQAGTSPNEALSFSATISSSWDVFDYDFGAGTKFPRVSPAALLDPAAPLDPGPATSHSAGGDVTWRPIDALRLRFEASRNRLARNDTRRIAYDSTLVSWRTSYQFTRFVFVRLRTDWDSAVSTLRGQYLFGWTPSPGTAIFAGYNDTATIDGVDPVSGAVVRGYQRSRRTVFVKLSYLLRRLV